MTEILLSKRVGGYTDVDDFSWPLGSLKVLKDRLIIKIIPFRQYEIPLKVINFINECITR